MSARPGRLVLLGHPVHHSLSPRFQSAALRHAEIPLTYEALDVLPAALPALVRGLRGERGAGNVTAPHKGAMAALCDRLTEAASLAGAVNTFWCDGEALVGDNTDIAGFEALVRHVMGAIPAGARVAVVGAGGAAGAVCAAVSRWPGGRILVVARQAERAEALARRFPAVAAAVATLPEALGSADLVVNATPVGMADDAVPVPLDGLRRDAVVTDLVYRPGETAWVRDARRRGHRAADGLEMLLAQGAHAFERWFGYAPDVGVMRAALAA